MFLGQARNHILYLAIYFLAGFGCFLTYVLFIRVLRIQYIYHYIPQIANPVLFTPTADIVIWALIFVIVCFADLLTLRRMSGSWTYWKSIVFVLTGILIIAFPFLVVSLTPWLVLFYSVPFFYLIYSPLKGLSRRFVFYLSAFAAFGTFLVIELVSAEILFSQMLGFDTLSLDIERQVLETTIDLTYTFQHYSVQLLLVLAFSWTAFPLLLLPRMKTCSPATPNQVSRVARIVLLSSVLLSALAIGIRYIGDAGIYGVDTRYYLNILMATGDVETLFKLLPSDPRVTYILLLKFLTNLGASPELAINIGPVILMILNSCASYMLGNEIARNNFAGALVGMFSALGMQTSTSLYAGIYANWLGMFLAVCAFAFYLRAVRTEKPLLFTLPGLLAVSALFVHPWSGLVFSLVLIFASLLDAVFLRQRRMRFVLAITLFACAITLILTVAYLFTPYRGTLAQLQPVYAALQIQNAQKLTSNLAFTMDYMVGGFTSAPIIYFTGLVGCIFLYKSWRLLLGSKLLFAWLVITSIPLLFAEQWIQWRLIYLMPIQVLSGLGVYYVSFFLISAKTRASTGLEFTLVCTVLVALVNYLLSSVKFIPGL